MYILVLGVLLLPVYCWLFLWYVYVCSSPPTGHSQASIQNAAPNNAFAHDVFSLICVVFFIISRIINMCYINRHIWRTHVLDKYKRGEGTVDWDTVASNRSTGSRLSSFNNRISSNNSNLTIWARWGLPNVSCPLPVIMPLRMKCSAWHTGVCEETTVYMLLGISAGCRDHHY